jgi:hypothetical protein
MTLMTFSWATLTIHATRSCAKGRDGNHQIVEPAGRRGSRIAVVDRFMARPFARFSAEASAAAWPRK